MYKYHPNPHSLSPGSVRLHARNYGIVSKSTAVIACPSEKPGGGGTGQGIRIAKDLNIPVFTCLPKDDRDKALSVLKEFEVFLSG